MIMYVCLQTKNNQMEQPPQDPRMDLMGNYVQKTLKLKPEKWTRMINTEEHKAVVMKFLERPSPMLLVIILTHTAQLIAANGFPLPQLKTKGRIVFNDNSRKFYSNVDTFLVIDLSTIIVNLLTDHLCKYFHCNRN